MIPEDYEKGYKEFLGIKIDLSKKPLIPREETEYLTEKIIEEIKDKKVKCLDLFAGSGCIGIALLKNNINAFCDFGEIEDDFIEQIKINLKENQAQGNVIKTNIFSNIFSKYDYILANPPYVDIDRIDEVGEDVKKHEPGIALYAGKRGMDLIRPFLEEAKDFLNEKGIIFMEFDEKQKEEIETIIKDNYSNYSFFKDQFGVCRFVRIEK